MVFKYQSSLLVNEVVPESFRLAADQFKEIVNVYGSGISYVFENEGIRNVINIIVQADRGPEYDTRAGQFCLLIEVDNTYIKTDSDCSAVQIQAFCLSYVEGLLENKGAGGGL